MSCRFKSAVSGDAPAWRRLNVARLLFALRDLRFEALRLLCQELGRLLRLLAAGLLVLLQIQSHQALGDVARNSRRRIAERDGERRGVRGTVRAQQILEYLGIFRAEREMVPELGDRIERCGIELGVQVVGGDDVLEIVARQHALRDNPDSVLGILGHGRAGDVLGNLRLLSQQCARRGV